MNRPPPPEFNAFLRALMHLELYNQGVPKRIFRGKGTRKITFQYDKSRREEVTAGKIAGSFLFFFPIIGDIQTLTFENVTIKYPAWVQWTDTYVFKYSVDGRRHGFRDEVDFETKKGTHYISEGHNKTLSERVFEVFEGFRAVDVPEVYKSKFVKPFYDLGRRVKRCFEKQYKQPH